MADIQYGPNSITIGSTAIPPGGTAATITGLTLNNPTGTGTALFSGNGQFSLSINPNNVTEYGNLLETVVADPSTFSNDTRLNLFRHDVRGVGQHHQYLGELQLVRDQQQHRKSER
jgi:hypothetical protein